MAQITMAVRVLLPIVKARRFNKPVGFSGELASGSADGTGPSCPISVSGGSIPPESAALVTSAQRGDEGALDIVCVAINKLEKLFGYGAGPSRAHRLSVPLTDSQDIK